MTSLAEEAHKRIAEERDALMIKARNEVDAEWERKINQANLDISRSQRLHKDIMDAARRSEQLDRKADETFDRIVGRKKRGRPLGSKNKPKVEFVGTEPEDDLIIRRH